MQSQTHSGKARCCGCLTPHPTWPQKGLQRLQLALGQARLRQLAQQCLLLLAPLRRSWACGGWVWRGRCCRCGAIGRACRRRLDRCHHFYCCCGVQAAAGPAGTGAAAAADAAAAAGQACQGKHGSAHLLLQARHLQSQPASEAAAPRTCAGAGIRLPIIWLLCCSSSLCCRCMHCGLSARCSSCVAIWLLCTRPTAVAAAAAAAAGCSGGAG